MAASSELKFVIEQMKEMQKAADGSAPTVETIRALTNGAAVPRPLPEGIVVKPISVDGVPCEWIFPDDVVKTKRLLYFHGGGYVAGNLDTHRPLSADIAAAASVAVLSVDYRLAPEHKSPAQVEDALTAYRWMLENGPDGPAEATRCFIAGDSAGGGLTLAALMAIRDAGLPPPNAAVTLSAWTDMTVSGDSIDSRADRDAMIRKPLIDFCSSCVVVDGGDARDPKVSPVFGTFDGLPPLLMQVGEEETLLDDTVRCAEQAEASGVDITLERWPDVFHVWQALGPIVPESTRAIDRIGNFISQHA